ALGPDPRLVGERRLEAGRVRLRRAEQQPDDGAFAELALDPRGAAGLARHAIDHRQAKAGALAHFLGGEEGLERALEHVRRHARAGVADAQLDIIAVLDFRVAGDGHLAAPPPPPAARRRGRARADRAGARARPAPGGAGARP